MKIVAGVTRNATSNVVFGPLIQQLLHTDLRSLHHLLFDVLTANFENQQEAAGQETLKIWLQKHNSPAEAKLCPIAPNLDNGVHLSHLQPGETVQRNQRMEGTF